MLKLGLNIDHVATLREARYRGRDWGEPDPVAAALIGEAAGAHGITVHLREDRRHIQDRDVWKLREVIKTRLNFEMANAPEIIAIALKLKPHVVCLVPERRQEVTTEGGLDVAGHWKELAETRKKMNDTGIDVSLFIAPDVAQIEASARVGAQFIELHTGAFAEQFAHHETRSSRREEALTSNPKSEIRNPKSNESLLTSAATDYEGELQRLISGAEQAHALGLKVNAGHGLNYQNTSQIHRVPHLIELNTGHSIISRAVTVGLATAVKEMLKLMEGYRS